MPTLKEPGRQGTCGSRGTKRAAQHGASSYSSSFFLSAAGPNPKLNPLELAVVLGDLAAHHASSVRCVIESCGARVLQPCLFPEVNRCDRCHE